MKSTDKIKSSINSKELYIEFILDKLQAVMPEVHRQVKVYEEKEKAGKLTPTPKNNPLFSE
ncbi:MAG: hypothetical protein JNL24_13165 [Bacteroidia bacterium]|nr:hypothetical protein [Bacteroidia bacterium]MCK6650226.1 hypothetical protein [Bacteroidia bacterium]